MSFKIFGELENKIKQLAIAGYNSNRIAVEVGLSEGSISNWAKRNNIILQKRTSPETLAKEERFLELLNSGVVLKHICIQLHLDHRAALKIVEKYGFSHLLRDRSKSGKDKRLSPQEVNSRLPKGHGEFSHYDEENKIYIIKRDDGSTYTRIHSQIFRGDPNLSEKRRDTEEEVAVKLLSKGYRLIPGTYSLKNESLQAEHIVCGYVRENSFRMFSKQSCPRCSNTGTSKEEREVDEYVKSLGFNTNKFRFPMDYKGKGKGKEIDILIKDLNFGIEYCGLHFHGEKSKIKSLNIKMKRHEKKGKKYEKTNFDSPSLFHKAKMDKAESLGIQLITLFSNEWKYSKDKVKSLIKAKLGKNETKLNARSLEIRELSKEEAETFMDTYHLQGYGPSLIAYGLFNDRDLVGAVSGNHHHMGNGEFVLNRLCFKSNTSIIGGSGKLMKSLEEWAKNKGFSEIKTWSDNRWSNGNVYKATGYELKAELEPSYTYFDNKGKTYSRHNLTKEKLQMMGGIGETEFEMALSLGYDRIFDCGKKTWIKKLI